MSKRLEETIERFEDIVAHVRIPVSEEHALKSSGADKVESRTVRVFTETVEQALEQI